MVNVTTMEVVGVVVMWWSAMTDHVMFRTPTGGHFRWHGRWRSIIARVSASHESSHTLVTGADTPILCSVRPGHCGSFIIREWSGNSRKLLATNRIHINGNSNWIQSYQQNQYISRRVLTDICQMNWISVLFWSFLLRVKQYWSILSNDKKLSHNYLERLWLNHFILANLTWPKQR